MKTVRMVGWVGLIVGGMLWVGSSVADEAKDAAPVPTANTDLPILSAYAWRGQVLNDEVVFQPALNLVKGGFGLNLWGSFNLTDSVTDEPDFSEIDLTASYGGKAGIIGWGVGLIEYLFPNSTLATDDGDVGYPGTREVYASLSLPDLVVVPTVSLYRDLDEGDGTYLFVALGYSRALMDKLTLGLSTSLGMADADYNSFYFGVDEAAVNDANVGASLAYALRDNLTITPSVQYTWLPDGDIEDGAAALYKDTAEFIASLKVNYVF